MWKEKKMKSKTFEVMINEDGMIEIPIEVLRNMGLQAGDQLVMR